MVLALGDRVRFGDGGHPAGVMAGALPEPPLFGRIVVFALPFDPLNPTQTGIKVAWNNGTTQDITADPGAVAEVGDADPMILLGLLGKTVELAAAAPPFVPTPLQLPNPGMRTRGVVITVYTVNPDDPTPLPVVLVRTVSAPNFARSEQPAFYEAPVAVIRVIKNQ